MRTTGRILVASIALVLLLACQSGETIPATPSSTQERATTPPTTTEISTPVAQADTTTISTPEVETAATITAETGQTVTPSLAPQERTSNKIAFVSRMGRSIDVWWMDSSGANLEQLTNDNWIERGLRWSPSGSAMAYASRPRVSAANSDQLWVLDVQSKQRRQLIDSNLVGVSAPTWNPDGHTIAYSTWVTHVPCIWVVDVETGDEVEITKYRKMPLWSPDGDKLAVLGPDIEVDAGFARVPMFSIIASDGEPFDLSEDDWQAHVTGWAWSHAGDRLLVTSEAGKSFLPGFAALEIVEAGDKTASIALSHTMKCSDEECDFYSPSWFPGDKEILFIAAVPLPPRAPYNTPEPDEPEGRWWLYRAADDLSSIQVVFESDLPISDAALSPDGMKVVFVQGEYSDAELWILDLGTGEIMQLTNNDVYDGEPVWQPQP
jgi:Tol biopolymer transport system component